MNFIGKSEIKLGCVVKMDVDSILPHAEYELNDHRKEVPPFMKPNTA